MKDNNKKHFTIPIFIPQLACPFQCVFCNQKSISGSGQIPDSIQIKSQLEKYLKTMPQAGSIIEAGFFGGSFTGLPLLEQEYFLKQAQVYLKTEKIQGIRISTRPDFIYQENLDLLKFYGVSVIEIGAQSFDSQVLKLSGRGHTAEDIIKAAHLIRDSGFELGIQMMIGLPGDTYEKSYKTAEMICELSADNTRIYPALVIKNTQLETLYKNKDYTPLSLEESIGWSKEILLLFEKSGVKVIKMGLHPSDGLLTGESLIAGPFHLSYRELVLSEIWKDIFKPLLIDSKHVNMTITTSPSEINGAAGYQSSNRKLLARYYNEVNFRIDNKLIGREYHVHYHR